MTFDQVVNAYSRYLAKGGKDASIAREEILKWLDWDQPYEDRFGQDVRIVLVSHEFSREITTAVIWLNQNGLDIRCVALNPYAHDGHVLLDVQHKIPLPEAKEYQIQVREKEERQRAARQQESTRDLTKYTVALPNIEPLPNLPKNRAMLAVVKGLVAAGTPLPEIQRVLVENDSLRKNSLLRSAPGTLDSQAFIAAVDAARRAEGATFNPQRYFCTDEAMIHTDGQTYALSNQWGSDFVGAIDALRSAFPGAGITCTPTSASDS